LGALSPLAVLERGYSIAHKLPDELIVKSSAELRAGDRLRVSFAQGKALCLVEEKE
jgi:exodeoxyribonuclease VII large subunit